MIEQDRNEKFISYLTAFENMYGNLIWQVAPGGYIYSEYEEPELIINLQVSEKLNEKGVLLRLRKHCSGDGGMAPFVKESAGTFYVDTDRLKDLYPDLFVHNWIRGIVKASLRYESSEDKTWERYVRHTTSIHLVIDREAVKLSMPKKIFLSHKGVNKPLVREYFDLLKTLNLDPWLDEDAMTAGVELDRAIQSGMEDSIAAIFFVTPEYKDEKFLSDEINHALIQRRKKPYFKIIVLVMEGSRNKTGVVPSILEPFVYKNISRNKHLEGLNQIIKALPITINVQYSLE